MTPNTASLRREADAWDEARSREMSRQGLTPSEISRNLRMNPYRRAWAWASHKEDAK